MNLIGQIVEKEIQKNIISQIRGSNLEITINGIEIVLRKMYDLIPDNKRISFGRVHAIKVLSKYLFEKELSQNEAENIFDNTTNWYAKSTALGVLSFYGVKDYKKVLHVFEKAADDNSWEMREMAQGFFKKIIKNYPDEMQSYLINLTKSKSENIRRFVSETLRPVQENKWFQKQPEYSLKILSNLFKESDNYPRTSVANNLSDLARQNPELIYSLVKELVESGDKNSYWIAYRACRNLVKKEPLRVMNLLKVDEYKYKNNKYKRSDY